MLQTNIPTLTLFAAPASGRQGWPICTHEFGGYPCKNTSPHAGNGRGCVHHLTSGFREDE